MRKKWLFAVVALALMPRLGHGEESKAVLDNVAKAMGDVKSLQYTGNGAYFFLGQSVAPATPWPRFNLKTYTRSINYDTPAMRDDFVRTQADPAARGGGGIPLVGEQHLIQGVSGADAWNQVGENSPTPAVAAVADRQQQLLITPQGVI